MRIVAIIPSLMLFFILALPTGCSADGGQINQKSAKTSNSNQKNTASYVERANEIVRDFGLTEIPLKCLKFEEPYKTDEFTAVVDVRELHNATCQGDSQTSPRLFSVAFDKNNHVWSDAKSLLGQMEQLK